MLPEQDSIAFTHETYLKFKEAHAKAIEQNQTRFFFAQREFVTAFAGYMLEYLGEKYDDQPSSTP